MTNFAIYYPPLVAMLSFWLGVTVALCADKGFKFKSNEKQR